MLQHVPEKHLNHLFRGRVEDLLSELPDDCVDTIFADPDYNVGVRYQGKSYTTQFGRYIDWCIAWSKECNRVLKPDGNFLIVNYPKNNAHLRVKYLDGAFEVVNEYAWVYHQNIGHSRGRFTTAHRSILHCTKTRNNRFYKNAVAEPYQNPTDGRIRSLLASGKLGRMPYSWLEVEPEAGPWFEVNLVKNVSRSKTFHSCQIPEKLSERLFKATCKTGDTVLVLFGGAGSELVVCQRLGLNWASAEVIPEYCTLIEERLKRSGEVPPESRMLTAIKARKRAPLSRSLEESLQRT